MEDRPGPSPALPWAVAAVIIVGLGAFALSRDEDEPPPPVVTTTTFPREGYIDAISAALTREADVALGEEGARCIARALVDTLGVDALEEMAHHAAPTASLTPPQRDAVLRLVVTCVDPLVAEALLGGGPSTTRAPVGLPDEGQ